MSTTVVSIEGGDFRVNGQPTYAGRSWRGNRIEGLLLNSRMVQGVFDDLNPATRSQWDYHDGPWDPDRNTDVFVAAMPEWHGHGLAAFTLNLQGGSPRGYSKEQPWHNSAFDADGSLRNDYRLRTERILDAADALGMVVILGLFYFGQDERLRDEAAVVRAVDEAVDWLVDRQDRHVLVEVANECDINDCAFEGNFRYEHAVLAPPREAELVEHVQRRSAGRLDTPAGRLLASTSYRGGGRLQPGLARLADFVLLHGNGLDEPRHLVELIDHARAVDGYHGQPIVVNEDDHFDFDRDDNHFGTALSRRASWGLFDYRFPGEGFEEGYQSVPTDWSIGSERKRGFFRQLRAVTGGNPTVNA